MTERRNKAEVARTLGPKGPHAARVKGVIHSRPRTHADGAPTGGANASDQRFNGQTVSPDSWNAGKRASRGQRAHSGSGHAKRFGVKPTGGAVADIYIGRPELSPIALLRGVEADHYGSGAHGAEWRLLQDAGAHAAGIGKERAALKRECERLIAAGSTRAEEVAKALGLR